jgi:16S rRNA (cytidine1402-2'-O)-methyltransferase
MTEKKDKVQLYVCGTPIGNLEDITLRTIRILKEADFIACEDTRVTKKLLNHLEIQKELISYHEHNKDEAGVKILHRMKDGERCALVSDAGMPGINDPGTDLIRLCLQEKIPYTVLPGPSAFLTALIFSGMKNEKFTYAGFFPRENNGKKEVKKLLDKEEGTLIYYESPHRIQKTTDFLAENFPERQIALVREISKVYEEMISGTAAEVQEKIKDRVLKGEFVIIIEGKGESQDDSFSEEDLETLFNTLLEDGLTKKEAMKKMAEISGHSKNDIYQKFMIK